MNATFFRDTVYVNDKDRSWNVVWTRGDYLRPTAYGFFERGDDIWQTIKLVDAKGNRYNVEPFVLLEQDWYEQCFWRQFSVPATVPVGRYSVELNKRWIGQLQVANRFPEQGYLVAVGKYQTQKETTYRSYGTTIVGGDITLAPGVSLIGLTFMDSIIQGPFTDGMMKDCRFVRCQVGGMVDWSKGDQYADHGALYLDCSFERTSVTGCCSGAFVNCSFTGRATGDAGNRHAFVNERGKRLAMVNCTFRQTDRGPVLRTAWGDNCDNLYAGVHVQDVNSSTNGNEVLCVENSRGRFDRNMVFGFRANNCSNHFQIWNTPADGNLVYGGKFGKGSTIHLSGLEPQRDNVIVNCTVAEAVKLSGQASGTKMEGVKVE